MIDENGVTFHPSGDIGAHAVGIGIHAAHFLLDRFGIIGEHDGIAQGFAHLCLPIGADKGGNFADHNLRNREDFGIIEPVEAPGDFARDFDVRLVILPNWHQVRARQQDISRLQHGIADKTEGHSLIIHVRGASHILDAGQAAEAGQGDQIAEKLRQLEGFTDGGLQEDGAALWVNAYGKVVKHNIVDVLRQLGHVYLLRTRGERVQVSDDKIAFVLIL
ncbi:MAG: hypothetical protein BWY63_01109 [Chloroflexi bacterium ADurb.Bin360]|nr:MAG: hypothetical protein BWY63_01109 [Chloroflexi bacterium ADurb.Bin360]